MRYVFILAARSAWNRRLTLGLTLTAIALSVALLLGVERIRHDARASFEQSVSGTDLVIGARTSPMQLILYSVFRIGEATNNVRWQSFLDIAAHPAVAWAIPLSLGDSHRGFPVLGTSAAYFEHFRFGAAQPLAIVTGRRFESVFEAVVGAEVAERLEYSAGSRIVLNHGSGDVSLAEHSDKPFTVVGVLARTGTPLDRTVHVPLEAIEAIHLDWQGGAPLPGVSIPAEFVSKFDLKPKAITSMLIGLKSRAGVFRMQRFVNEYSKEPLLAILPAVALEQLWQLVGIAERALLAISGMVVAVGLAGLIAVVLASLNERRRELAILRSVGARPRDIFMLLMIEGTGVTLIGALLGAGLVSALIAVASPWVSATYGLALSPLAIGGGELMLFAAVVMVGLTASLIPGWRAYRMLLSEGLTPRI